MSSEDSASFPPVIGAKLVPYRTTPVLFISEIVKVRKASVTFPFAPRDST